MYDVSWKKAEAAFYGFMRHGWVANHFPKEVLGVEGYRTFAPPNDGTYKLIDMWTRTPSSDYSAGLTTLYQRTGFDWIPIWAMHYGGWYTQMGSDVVKAALRNAYSDPSDAGFRGCRGPQQQEFPELGALYFNDLEHGGSFQKFRGTERVITARDSNRLAGEHEYFGMSLV